jgi:hypothetical protein
MKSLLFTAILSLRKRSEQILITFAILLQVRLTHAQTFFRGVICTLIQAFSQKGVQAFWDAPRIKNGRLWTLKFWGKREIIFNYFPKYINIFETK